MCVCFDKKIYCKLQHVEESPRFLNCKEKYQQQKRKKIVHLKALAVKFLTHIRASLSESPFEGELFKACTIHS